MEAGFHNRIGAGSPDQSAQSPDGLLILMSDANYMLFIWQNNIESWKTQACKIASRNLTRSKWAQYIGDAMPYQAVCENLPIEPEITSTPTP